MGRYIGIQCYLCHIHRLVKLFLWNNFDTLYWNVCLPHETHHHHYHVVPPARISQILSRHSSLSFIASGRSLRLHPVSSQSCCMYIPAGRLAFARLYEGVHRSTSLMSSSLLLKQCPACLVRLTLIVFVIGGRWPIRCFVGSESNHWLCDYNLIHDESKWENGRNNNCNLKCILI